MPEPWLEGERIPWDDADFSQRMLKEHLSQDHDMASRRFEIIERQVQWIHGRLLRRRYTRILDIGCGPGLYTSRLAKLGHQCTGIDYSPASIEYAQKQAEREKADCSYILGDVRRKDFGGGYQLAMIVFGGLNVMKIKDARALLKKVFAGMEAEGILLLEVHTYSGVFGDGGGQTYWFSEESGLFSEKPHLVLGERYWDEAHRTATERYYVIEAVSGAIRQFSAGMQAYTEEQYAELLGECGFRRIEFHPSMGGEQNEDFMVITARR